MPGAADVGLSAGIKAALADYLVASGDDELILGHRLSEWCAHAPILEEDIAFANLALDEIGHASLWYTLAAELRGEDAAAYPDQLVYTRPAGAYRCIQMVELPNGDWAFSILRQCLFDLHEQVLLEKLAASPFPTLAAVAAKIRKEELYHARHSRLWLQRLGLGTEESHRRMQTALDALWPYTTQLHQPLPGEATLISAGIVPPAEALQPAWESLVLPLLSECSLTVPAPSHTQDPDHPSPIILHPSSFQTHLSGPRTQHTPHLPLLLADLQYLNRLYPSAAW